MPISYEELTVGDPNPVKRWLHRRRYARAAKLIGPLSVGAQILDFGSGSGELAHELLDADPDAKLTLFEPSANMQKELVRNTERYGDRVKLARDFEQIADRSFSAIFCLSVLEHLPDAEIDEALSRIHQVSTPESKILVEVPNELYLAALLKGALRHVRRPDEYDGDLRNILQAGLGRPPFDRPLIDSTGIVELPWHGYHTGFDHRELHKKIERSGLFEVADPTFAPVNHLGALASLDVYFNLSKATE